MNNLQYISAGGLFHSDGAPAESLDAGLEADPAFIGGDAGSIDVGAHYLGSGENMHASREATKEAYRTLVTRARQADIPLLVGSAATAGIDQGVDWTCELIREIAEEEDLEFDLARIYCEQSDADLKEYNGAGAIEALPGEEPLTDQTIDESAHVVGMMGPEGFIEALDRGADVIIAGRSSDVSIYNAYPIREGYDEALATHLAKLVECQGLLVTPPDTAECVLATLTDESFTVSPTNPEKRMDVKSAAAYMLYEVADPTSMIEPRGILDPTDATYEAVDDRTVEVRGSKFEPTDQYTVKLEGARQVGYRTLTAMGVRDPILIDQLDSYIDMVRGHMDDLAMSMDVDPGEYVATFHTYGKDGVLKEHEPVSESAHEVGVLVDVVAPTQDAADALAARARLKMVHSDYPGRKSTSGNVAFPMSPTEVSAGPAYEFSVWHTMAVDDPLDPFDIHVEHVGGDA